NLGQFLVNRGCDSEFVQVPKQLFPPRVAPKANVFGSAGGTRQRSSQGIGQEVGQIVDVRSVFHREVVQRITFRESGDHSQVMRLGLAWWFRQRPEVRFPGFLLMRQPFQVRLDEGCTLAKLQPWMFFGNVPLTSAS